MISDGNKITEVTGIWDNNKWQYLILLILWKNTIKKDTSNELELQKAYNYPIYPRDSKIFSDKGFYNIDNGSQGGTHWCCFIIKDKRTFYYDSFGGVPVIFLLRQLP